MTNMSGSDRNEKLLSLAALVLAIELVLFKFLPDISTAVIQNATSDLTDFETFRRHYIVPGGVFYPRFAGNYILWQLAQLLRHLAHSADIRLHPLRLAAALVTPLYACLGALPALQANSNLNWRWFMAAYAPAIVIGLYVFYPADMPALAALSAAVYCLLRERLAAALAYMLLTGLFRESAFHMVALVGLWALCSPQPDLRRRLVWVAAFALAFAAEYRVVRHWFPGPMVAGGGLILDPRQILLGNGMLSFTTTCSLGFALLFPLACLNRLRLRTEPDWRHRFFVLNCWMLPAWVVFYRMMNGNMTEFRLLLPALLPCMYGLAYATRMAAPGPDIP